MLDLALLSLLIYTLKNITQSKPQNSFSIKYVQFLLQSLNIEFSSSGCKKWN